MGQVGTEAAVGDGSVMVWQLMQAFFMKTAWPSVAAASPVKSCWAGLLLLRDPRGEVLWSLRVDAQKHLGVLRSAVLRALAEDRGRSRADRSTSC